MGWDCIYEIYATLRISCTITLLHAGTRSTRNTPPSGTLRCHNSLQAVIKQKKKKEIAWHPASYLFVHYDVDHRVVDGGALGKESRDGHEDGPEVRPLVGEDVESNAGIGDPADQEGDDHDDDHAGHFFLCLLGGGRLLLLGGSLQADRNGNAMELWRAAVAWDRGQGLG